MAITFNQLLNDIATIWDNISMVGEQVQRRIPIGRERYEAASFDPFSPERVGTIGSYDVVIDRNIVPVPRKRCSPEFRKIQHPDLVKATDEWYDQFFGRELPIYQIGNKLMMHPDTLKRFINEAH